MGATVTTRKFEGGYINLNCPITGEKDWSVVFSTQYTSGWVLLQTGFSVAVTAGVLGACHWNSSNTFSSSLNVSVPDANMHTYAYVCSGTTGIRYLYLDGILVASDNNGTIMGSLDGGKIGINRDTNVTGFTNGFLTELLFFKKCLSANEVKALVGNINPDTTGMVGRYKFNEAAGVNTASPTVGTVFGTYVGTWNAPQSVTLPNVLPNVPIAIYLPQPILFC